MDLAQEVKNKWLIQAIEENCYESTEALLKIGADVHYNDDFPLITAIDRDLPRIVELLLEYGADPNAQNEEPIRGVCHWRMRPDILGPLMHYGANVHHNNDILIARASLNYDGQEILPILINAGADVNARNGTPLRNAVECGHMDNVRILVDAGADIHVYNNSPILAALSNDHDEIAEYLAEKILKDNGIGLLKLLKNGHSGLFGFIGLFRNPDLSESLLQDVALTLPPEFV